MSIQCAQQYDRACALIGAGIGAGAGALVGLSSRRSRILKPALIGGGIGAGIGLGYGLLTHSRHNCYNYY